MHSYSILASPAPMVVRKVCLSHLGLAKVVLLEKSSAHRIVFAEKPLLRKGSKSVVR